MPLKLMYLANSRRRKARKARKTSRTRRTRSRVRARVSRKVRTVKRRASRVVRNRSRKSVRRRRTSAPVARRSGSRRRRSGGGSLKLGGVFSKENLMLAGGVVAGSIVTGMALAKIGSKLPGYATGGVMVKAAYAVAIPVAAGLALRKVSPTLSKGMMLAGVVAGLTTAVNVLTSKMASPQTTSAYLNRMNAFINPGSNMPPGNLALKSFSASPGSRSNLLAGTEGAFKADAWN